jgi:hypothetical protein
MRARILSLTTLIERAGAFDPCWPGDLLCRVWLPTLWFGSDAESEWTPTYPGAEAGYGAGKWSYSCGVGVSFEPLLPCCVRIRHNREDRA